MATGLYRQKLVEAQAAVKKLETAYIVQNQQNAKLQGAARSGRDVGCWVLAADDCSSRHLASLLHP